MRTMMIKNTGFTLIELAIVLVIVGVLAGTFLSTLGSRIDTTRRVEATEEMEVIKQALYGYAMTQTNPHLPCPDCRSPICPSLGTNFANDGVEDRNGAVCDVGNFPGNIPWVTLGTGFGDPWNNRYSYWVSPEIVIDDLATGFKLVTPITTATIKTRIGVNTPDVSDKAVAVIMSQGKNGYGAVTTQNTATSAVPAANIDEIDNRDGDAEFYSRAPTEAAAATAGGEFDDIIVWISEYELKAKMVESGKLP